MTHCGNIVATRRPPKYSLPSGTAAEPLCPSAQGHQPKGRQTCQRKVPRRGSLVLLEDPVPDAVDGVGDPPGVDVVAAAVIGLAGRHHRSLLQYRVVDGTA